MPPLRRHCPITHRLFTKETPLRIKTLKRQHLQRHRFKEASTQTEAIFNQQDLKFQQKDARYSLDVLKTANIMVMEKMRERSEQLDLIRRRTGELDEVRTLK